MLTVSNNLTFINSFFFFGFDDCKFKHKIFLIVVVYSNISLVEN